MRIKAFLLSALMIGSVGTVSVSADLLGDANGDGVLNVRDCAMIARKLAEDKADELSPETADYNGDGIINVRDAAAIAGALHLNFNNSKTQLNDIASIKAYVNERITQIALEKYGVAEIVSDDNVKSNTWYLPAVLLTDIDYYSTVTSVEEYGIEGIMPGKYVTNAEDAIRDLEGSLIAISQRVESDGRPAPMSKRRIRIKWVQIGEADNYEIYLCYGGDY